ncbi:MAG: right-handed parallel beta-helix repeat-containing protein [Flavobacteriales bacterium]|nr:right-handed parallel beta-helix repeat-containing protein [Flavobacteriales bacterium]
MEALVVGRKYDHIEIEFRSYRNRMIHSMVGSGSAAVGLTLAAWKEDEYRTMNTKNTSPRPMRHLLCISALLACASTYPQTYYVDANVATSGDGSIGAPFKTIADLNNAVGPISSGESVKLARGGEYPGTITVASGSQNVTIEAYGSGANPLILGTEDIAPSAWTHQGGGLWRINVVDANAQYHLYEGGGLNAVRREPARHPNVGYLRNETYTDGGATGTIELSPGTPLGSVDPIGAQLVCRTRNWQYEHVRVTGLNAQGGLEFQPSLGYDIGTDNWGLFLQGTFALIDQVGEWGTEDIPGTSNDHLYYYTGDLNNPPEGVAISRTERGVRIEAGFNNVTVRNVDFMGQYGAGVTFGQGTGLTIEGCTFNDLRRGIDDRSSSGGVGSGHTLMYNSFTNCHDYALLCKADNTTAEHNTFTQIGIQPEALRLAPNYPGNVFGSYGGASFTGHGYTFRYNLIEQVGNAALSLNGQGLVEYNTIRGALQTLNDAGAIQIDYCDGLELRTNIITEVGDNVGSLETTATEYDNYGAIFYGIYFGDHYIVNTRVDGNTVSDATKGIHVDHNLCSENAIVTNNILFNNDVQLSITDLSNYQDTYMVDDEGAPLPVGCIGDGSFGGMGAGANHRATYSDVYERNILYSLRTDQLCLELGQAWASGYAGTKPLVDFGTFDHNYYCNPFSKVTMGDRVSYNVTGVTQYLSAQVIPYTLEGWRSAKNEDHHSSTSPLHLKDYALTAETPTGINHDDDLDGGVANWTCTGCGSGAETTTVVNGTDLALRSTNCTWVERGCDPLQAEPVDGNNSGAYVFRFKMRAEGVDAMRLAPVFESTYRNEVYFGVSPEWRDHELVVNVTDGGNGDNLYTSWQNLQFGLGATTSCVVDVDDVVVRRATVDPDHYANEVAPNHILRYNNPLDQTTNDPQNVAATGGEVTLGPGCWSDVYGTIYSGSVDLDPWESIVLFKLSGAFDHANGYTVSGDEVWSTDKNIRGSLVVPNGASLTIDGATIGFADSRVDNNPTTNVVVQPGGVLRLVNGAVDERTGCGLRWRDVGWCEGAGQRDLGGCRAGGDELGCADRERIRGLAGQQRRPGDIEYEQRSGRPDAAG